MGGTPVSLVPDSRTGHRPVAERAADLSAPGAQEYQFLLARHVDATTLSRACTLAEQWGVHPHHVLIANGWLREEDYYRALAETTALSFRPDLSHRDALPPAQSSPRQCLAQGLLQDRAHPRHYVFAPGHLRPNMVRAVLAKLGPSRFSLATARAVRDAVYHYFAPALARGAVETLALRRPDLSARSRTVPWQRTALLVGAAAVLSVLVLAPIETVRTLTLLLALCFVPIIALRACAAWTLGCGALDVETPAPDRAADASLPVYTILAPLYREGHMLPSLLAALRRLDWPAAKLDIKLILEASDRDTISAARAARVPSNVEIVVVPDCAPRTKPKALNHALPLARGEYLVIYDAEDQPDPDQLHRAYRAFQDGPPNLATVQAHLNVYNVRDSWLTRQFTLEYSALFDGLLPLLDRLKLPIPLGGTSNHFRVSALRWLLAWDPYNVTEDADLGTRLARNGYRCSVIASTTYEEAPARLGSWIRQRTRWLKGFIQTWLVHMRRPAALWRDLGPSGFLGFQTVVGGTILSALVHPWFYVLVAAELLVGGFLALPSGLIGLPLWTVAWFDLVVGYGAAMALAGIAARRRGLKGLTWQLALMPLYWLLVSAAAYRALWQFVTAPFKWEKTEHGQAATSRRPANRRLSRT